MSSPCHQITTLYTTIDAIAPHGKVSHATAKTLELLSDSKSPCLHKEEIVDKYLLLHLLPHGILKSIETMQILRGDCILGSKRINQEAPYGTLRHTSLVNQQPLLPQDRDIHSDHSFLSNQGLVSILPDDFTL